jgi:hypothetical protein
VKSLILFCFKINLNNTDGFIFSGVLRIKKHRVFESLVAEGKKQQTD